MNQQLLLEIIPAPVPRLENTVVGVNSAAIDAAKTLSAGHALYIWGVAGSGKTHLMKAMTYGKTARFCDQNTSAQTMFDLATQGLNTQNHCELVLIDNIHDMDSAQQAAVFALYNHWREVASTSAAFALVVSGDRAPLAMDLREDLRTRLGWDLVFRLDPLSDEDKLSALETYAQQIGLPLSSEVLQWMFTHYARDIRQLFALVDALDRYSLSKHRTITVPLLRAMLSDRDFLQS